MSEKYLSVTITSERPATTGGRYRSQSGEGVVLSDEPDTVYVTGKGWYGSWPVDETDVPILRAEAKAREETARLASLPAFAPDNMVPMVTLDVAYDRLTGALKAASPGIEHVTTSYLLTQDGKYIRLPSKDEFSKTFDELDRDGKVQR